MTFFNKWLKDHQDEDGSRFPPNCPDDYGYEKKSHCEDNHMSCATCWTREMPEEVKEEKKPMTFLDKWKKEHPSPHVGMSWPPDCPYEYMYEDEKPHNCHDMTCYTCWIREIPEEPKEDKKMIYAHMGFSEEQAEAIEELNEGKKTPNEVREMFGLPKILDSGARREFGTGAVRDIQGGKGRCDLLPLDVICHYRKDAILGYIANFQEDGTPYELGEALNAFVEVYSERGGFKNDFDMLLEVSIHFEEGAKKYGESNWKFGIPVRCYIDSAVRHYLKFLRGDKDEPHHRAFAWNLMCAMWTCKNKPELNDYAKRDISEVEETLG